jgi:hypothetical protein
MLNKTTNYPGGLAYPLGSDNCNSAGKRLRVGLLFAWTLNNQISLNMGMALRETQIQKNINSLSPYHYKPNIKILREEYGEKTKSERINNGN